MSDINVCIVFVLLLLGTWNPFHGITTPNMLHLMLVNVVNHMVVGLYVYVCVVVENRVEYEKRGKFIHLRIVFVLYTNTISQSSIRQHQQQIFSSTISTRIFKSIFSRNIHSMLQLVECVDIFVFPDFCCHWS